MAYLLEIKTKCDTPYCKSRAAVEVMDRFNDSRGRYCRKHGEQRRKELERAEKDYHIPSCPSCAT